jgi:hypothetical protein
MLQGFLTQDVKPNNTRIKKDSEWHKLVVILGYTYHGSAKVHL